MHWGRHDFQTSDIQFDHCFQNYEGQFNGSSMVTLTWELFMWWNRQNNKNTDCIESLYNTKQAIVAFSHCAIWQGSCSETLNQLLKWQPNWATIKQLYFTIDKNKQAHLDIKRMTSRPQRLHWRLPDSPSTAPPSRLLKVFCCECHRESMGLCV